MYYYRHPDGSYVGAFDEIQPDLIDCPPPQDGRQRWDDAAADWAPFNDLRPLSAEEFIVGLLYLNILPDQIDATIAALPEPDRTLALWRWQRSQSFARHDWLIGDLSAALSITPAALDEAWAYVIGLDGS